MQIALLNKEKTIKDLVAEDVDTSIGLYIKDELAKDEFNFIVTADNLAFAKTKMADLNKSIKFIDTFRKDKVTAESVAIDTFKDNVKKYVALIDKKREDIKKDVEVFERETKASITKELSLYSDELIKTQNIRDNFIDVDIIDLIALGSVTTKGALTKKAKETIEARVAKCKAKQDKYDMRLMQLENLSYQNGLETPLTITHIQGIISLDDDNEYESKLSELISSEMERQKTIKANILKKATEDAQQNVLNEQRRIYSIFHQIISNPNYVIDSKIDEINDMDYSQFGQFENYAREQSQIALSGLNLKKDEMLRNQAKPEVETVEETIPFTEKEKAEQINEVAKSTNGKKIVRIKAIFEVTVPSRIPSDAVLNKVNNRLVDAGISEDTLKSLEVV